MRKVFNAKTCASPTMGAHGGHCCGISHIYGFNNYTNPYYAEKNVITNAEEAAARIRHLIESYPQDADRSVLKFNRLYEAVLKEGQREFWEPVLLACGFSLSIDFTNSNSGNRCYVYHYAMGPKNRDGAFSTKGKKAAKGTSVPNPFES